MKRTDWVLRFPGQVVLAASQVFWTHQVTEAIQKRSIDVLASQLKESLDELVILVRQDLTPIARLVLGALIVVDVHARDVVNRLQTSRISSVNDFEWISQLRHYWDDNNLCVKTVNASFPYGYEYLGNTGRLVITPLTDRCYLTLAMAMHMTMGGAPAGL